MNGKCNLHGNSFKKRLAENEFYSEKVQKMLLFLNQIFQYLSVDANNLRNAGYRTMILIDTENDSLSVADRTYKFA
jgi:hypothetical protein